MTGKYYFQAEARLILHQARSVLDRLPFLFDDLNVTSYKGVIISKTNFR